MIFNSEKAILLMAEDDDDDYGLAKEALFQAQVNNDLYRVKDGEELVSYLKGEDHFSDRTLYPLPNLIFLDLNMPKMNGKEALSVINKANVREGIPILVMTTSSSEVDVIDSYDLGVNSFIRKPVSYGELVNLMRDLGKYWFETVDLPIINS